MTELNGILPLYKPQGFTSFDAVKKLRGMLRIKKIGHAGTLDPMATGVLPVFLGNATKACDILPDQDKLYRVSFQLGQRSDTQDIWGNILSVTESHVTFSQLRQAAADFTGEIMQIPPMYSALKVNGQRLYDIARKGGTVERQPRPVTIYSFQILEFDENSQQGSAEIHCSKGTYIRTICNDIGEKLGVGGLMTGLERCKACGFTLENCLTFEDIAQSLLTGDLAEKILPTQQAFSSMPDLFLNPFQEKLFCNGVRLDLKRLNICKDDKLYRVFGAKSRFLGIAKQNFDTDELICVKSFYQRSEG